MKVTEHHFKQALRSLTGCTFTEVDGEDGIVGSLAAISALGYLNLPCEPERLFAVEDRIANVRVASKNKSLLNQLTDRHAETGVVVDSCLVGKNALFLASLLSSKEECIGWMHSMSDVRFVTIEHIKDSYLIVASLASFVPLRDDS